MNPKTPLPWSDVPWTDEEEENLIDEKDVAFLVHAANSHEKYRAIINKLCNALSMYHNTGLSDCDEGCEYLKLIQQAREEIK